MEPERRIEKVLRAFAKKRREQTGEPMPLRPAARQELHREISRRATSKGGSGFFSHFLFGLRPSIAFALCAVAIAIAGWLLLPNLSRHRTETLASATFQTRKAIPAEAPAPPAIPPPATSSQPTVTAKEILETPAVVPAVPVAQPAQPTAAAITRERILSNNEASKQTDVLENSAATTTLAPGTTVASAPPPNNETLAFKNQAVTTDSFAGADRLQKDSKDRTLLPAAPPAGFNADKAAANTLAARDLDTRKKLKLEAQPAPSARTAFFANIRAESAAAAPVASQIFNRVDVLDAGRRASGALAAPAPVLATFRVEQKGSAMRVVDADGSIYTGAVQVAQSEKIPTTRAFDGTPKNKSFAPPASNLSPQTAQNYFFRVTGTNRNLNQNVVFSGNLIPLTNALSQVNGSIGGAGGVLKSPPELPAPALLLNSRISGTAVIGNQREIEVNATPTP